MYKEVYKKSYIENIEAIENYIIKYEESFGQKPSEKLIRQYCKMRGIEYPLPTEEVYIKRMMEKW